MHAASREIGMAAQVRTSIVFLHHTIIGAFTRDLDVMHVTFFQTSASDFYKIAVFAHLVDGGTARVAHGSAQPADELMDHGTS